MFPEQPVRQGVLIFSYPMRFLFASRPVVMRQVLGIICGCIATRPDYKAAFPVRQPGPGRRR